MFENFFASEQPETDEVQEMKYRVKELRDTVVRARATGLHGIGAEEIKEAIANVLNYQDTCPQDI